MSASAPALISTHRTATQPRWRFEGAWFQLAVFAFAFLIVWSRRPDAIVIPQFYAEDGTVSYSEAYSLGAHSLLLPRSGYFQAVPRLVALLAQLVPLGWAPLVMSLAAMVIQILPVNVFLSSRFSNIENQIRMLGCFVYLALPNSFEIHATLTNAHSHLILLSCLLLLAPPATTRGWKIFDSVILALTCLSSPIGILLLPLAAIMWCRKGRPAPLSLAVLAPASTIQTICVLMQRHMRDIAQPGSQPVLNSTSLGMSLPYLNAILGRQVFFSSLIGLNAQNWLMHLQAVHIFEAALTGIGLALLLYTLIRGPLELKLFLSLAAAVLVSALANPLAGPVDHPQWYWLSLPGIGNRYYFLPMLAFLASLFWLATNKLKIGIRWFAITLLLLLPIGICRDWTYPPFMNLGFQHLARAFDNAPSGTQFTFPINPLGWYVTLIKH